MSFVSRIQSNAVAAAMATAALCFGLPGHASAMSLTSLPGLVVTSSSDYVLPANGPNANILDGNYSTYWNAGAYTGWVQVDFGADYQFDEIDLFGNFNVGNTFSVLASSDGINFGVIGAGSYQVESLLGPPTVTGGPGYGARLTFSGPSAPIGRYLRYEQVAAVSLSNNWAYLGELAVTGHVAAVPLPGALGLLASAFGLLGGYARKASRAQG